ncbi:MAG TPA: glutathione S-transferase family protein [Steroidobacter sp.]
MLKVYGTPVSRTSRTLWLCRELGLDYEHVPVHYVDGGTQAPEFLAINPFGKIPAIDDDGFKLSESMAINLYLAKKHGSDLMPRDLEGEAQVLQWSFWVVAEVERPLVQALLQRMDLPPDNPIARFFAARQPKDPKVEQAALEALVRPFKTLDEHLAGREYLLGAKFTLADLNVASVMNWVIMAKIDLTPYPNLQGWLERCLARPAAKPPKK